jgi:hypothetical protein
MNRLTPKEKAKELYHKYADEFNFDDTYRGYREQSKQCALIAVNEILNLDDFSIEGREYWEEVKEEIELL